MRLRSSPRAIAGVVGLAVFTVWITWRAKTLEFGAHAGGASSALIGKAAPEFSLESLDGRKISLSDYRGKTVVLAFWASWCGPCRMEMPLLTKFYQDNHTAASDFEILGISIDTDKGPAKSAADSFKLPFTVLLDADSRLAGGYGVDSIPALFIVDKTGKVAYSRAGFETGLDIILAHRLGIKSYTVSTGAKQ